MDTGFVALLEEGKKPQWYEYVVGVIGIPAALVGFAYTYALVKKTRLESRRLELEIQEKSAPAPIAVASASAARDMHNEALTQTLISRRYSVLILRWVFVELSLGLYRMVTFPLQRAGASSILLHLREELDSFGADVAWVRVIVLLFQDVFANIFEIGYWVLFLILAWPLFRDVASILGIQFRDYSPIAIIRSLRQETKSSR